MSRGTWLIKRSAPHPNPLPEYREREQENAKFHHSPLSHYSNDMDGPEDASDLESAKMLADAYLQLQTELGKVIVGQQRVIDELLTALFASGHCLV